MNKKPLTFIVVSFLLMSGLFYTQVHASEPSNMFYSRRFILLDKYTGYGGSEVRVRGYGFYPNEQVQIYLKDDKDDVLTYVTTDNYGNFASISKTIPDWKAGKYKLYAYGEVSNNRESADFYLRGFSPWARPSKYYVHVGEKLGFQGFGFKPNSEIPLYYGGDLVHTFATDSAGRFDSSDILEIVPQWEDDDIKMHFIEPSTGKKIKFKITVAKEYK